MTDDKKLDEILTIVRNLRSLDATVIEMRNRADEAVTSERTNNEGWIEYHEKAVAALLLGWKILHGSLKFMNATDAERNAPEMKKAREDWADQKGDFLHAARQVWSEEEDPYYDPNRDPQ